MYLNRPLLIKITHICKMDGFHQNKAHNLTGAIILASSIMNSTARGYFAIGGLITKESRIHNYEINRYIYFSAVKYKECALEDIIEQLRNKDIGRSEYIF